MMEFISEEDLETFEGWLKYQAVEPSTADEFETWRRLFEETRKLSAASPKVGLMKLQRAPGEYRYAVAVRDGGGLWLALWVRRSPKGELFVMLPRSDRGWNQHTSYHLDGTLHVKSHGHKVLTPQQRQPLTSAFHGTEHLGAWYGYGPKSVGAVCDPTAFSGVLEVGPGVLGPRDGGVTVDLVEPGHEPWSFAWSRGIVTRGVFRDAVPWVVLTVGA